MNLVVSHVVAAGIGASVGALWMRNRRERKHKLNFPASSQALSTTDPQTSFGMRLFQGVFIFGWLIAWTAAIFVVTATLFSGAAGSGSVFLLGWLIAAIAGWVAAVYALARVVQGKPIKRFGG